MFKKKNSEKNVKVKKAAKRFSNAGSNSTHKAAKVIGKNISKQDMKNLKSR